MNINTTCVGWIINCAPKDNAYKIFSTYNSKLLIYEAVVAAINPVRSSLWLGTHLIEWNCIID